VTNCSYGPGNADPRQRAKRDLGTTAISLADDAINLGIAPTFVRPKRCPLTGPPR
jgi:hypothetical protein